MDTSTATLILEAATVGGYYDEEPDTDAEVIKTAEFFLAHARATPEAEQNDTTRAIVKLAEDAQSDEGYVAPEEEQSPEADIARTTTQEAPDLPYDLTEVKDKQIRKLSGQFQVHLNEVTRELSVAQTQVLRAKQLRKGAYNAAYLAEANTAQTNGVKITTAVLDMAASSAPAVVELDKQVFELEVQERNLKALRDIYSGNVDRLSREMTMRTEELRAERRR